MFSDYDISVIYALLLLCLLLGSCTPSKTELEKILERGVVNVVTRNGPATYYLDKDSETGLEYELARRFADSLGVELNIIVARNKAEIVGILENGDADLAAAALTDDNHPESTLVFGPGYHWITQQIVYRTGYRRPESLEDLHPQQLYIADGTIQDNQLEQIKALHPAFTWSIVPDKDNYELLEMVQNEEIRYSVTDSNELALIRHFFPELRAAFIFGEPQPLTWAFSKKKDSSLPEASYEFFEQITASGELAELVDYFFGSAEGFDYVDSVKFVQRFETRLPQYKPIFEQAAKTFDLDWRLLAALSYQESHWDKNARSPTGVRGMMMLTLNTAESVGVENRLDPEQSIIGGAKYLQRLVNRVPERILEPDRTWFALAAYNIGYGHLEDARVITERQGGNPDSWQAVKERLPLLRRKKWYQETKYGYARGVEPVRFVERTRKYYNILVQLTQPVIESYYQSVEMLLIDSPVL